MKRFILALSIFMSTSAMAGPCVDAFTNTLVAPNAPAEQKQKVIDTWTPLCVCVDNKVKASGFDPASPDFVRIKKDFMPFTMRRVLSGQPVYAWEREQFASSLDHPMSFTTWQLSYATCSVE